MCHFIKLAVACQMLLTTFTAVKPKLKIEKLMKMKQNPPQKERRGSALATLLDCPVPGPRHTFPGKGGGLCIQIWKPLNHP